MRLLVTGAGGMLGRDVVGAAQDAGMDVRALTHADLDIADGEAVDAVIRAAGPDVAVNCAAWTDVDGAEEAFADAVAVNGTGAGNLARAATAAGAAPASGRRHDRPLSHRHDRRATLARRA